MASKKGTAKKAPPAVGADTKAGYLDAIDAARGKYGEGAVSRYGDAPRTGIEVIPTGSFELDLALGVGGYPRGRIIEIYGPEASGKTTLTLHAMASAQREGGNVAFVDAEHALDPAYATKLGVSMDDLAFSQPDYGEQGLNIVQDFAASGQFSLIVVDSIAALTPKAEIEGEVGDVHVGLQARMMSQALRKLASVANRSATTIIFINQIRMKIGVMFGSPETTTGGNALKYYASIRLDVRRKDKLQLSGELAGNVHHVRVLKNKLAPPFKEIDFNLWYGLGIDRYQDLGDIAIRLGVLTKAGSWFRWPESEENLCQGRFKLTEVLTNDEATRKRVIDAVTKRAKVLRWVA